MPAGDERRDQRGKIKGMTVSCEDAFDNLNDVQSNICLASNVLYTISAMVALWLCVGWERWTIFALAFVTSVVSALHHSNATGDAGSTPDDALGITDQVFAWILAIVLGVLLAKGLKGGTIDKSLSWASIFIACFSGALFVFSSVEYGRIDEPRTHTGGGGLLLAKPDVPEKDWEDEGKHAVYFTYHSMWHLMSGVAILLAVLAVAGSESQRKKRAQSSGGIIAAIKKRRARRSGTPSSSL